MNYHVFYNTNRLGGAERSLTDTLLALNPKCTISCYIPTLDGATELKDFIKGQLPNAEIVDFEISQSYYRTSRQKNIVWQMLTALPGLFLSLMYLRKFRFSTDSTVWLNGNKVAVLVTLSLRLRSFKGRVFWHLRDYFPHSGLMSKILEYSRSLNLKFIANSYSVRDELLKKQKVVCLPLYNQPPALDTQARNFGGVIGLASMLAPWKGIHDVLWMLALIQKEVAVLGYHTVKIYGENIYQTSGEHHGYKDQLIKIAAKITAIKIEFCGLEKPDIIMRSIDVLIHSSIAPEPFGRVIVEAMASDVAVISTALGGANELTALERAWRYFPSHEHSLVNALKECANESIRVPKLAAAQKFIEQLEHTIKQQQNEISHDFV